MNSGEGLVQIETLQVLEVNSLQVKSFRPRIFYTQMYTGVCPSKLDQNFNLLSR